MKKIVLLLLMLPAILLAAPVDPNLAQQVAETYINAPEANSSGVNKAPRKPKRMARLAKQVTENQQFYIYQNPDGKGFVIVSADDVARPILGYSHSGTIDVDNMPDNMRWWLSEYDRQIRWAKENNIQKSPEIAQEWEHILTKKVKAATPVVGPLIQTHWDQKEPYYNKCPYNGSGHALTGCVATAMAQVMRYWCWPNKGFGSREYVDPELYIEGTWKNLWQDTYIPSYGTQYADFGATNYDWYNMPERINGTSSPLEINAIATLMYHCGVAVDMDYGPEEVGGSAAKSKDIPRAACNYFYYSNAIKYIEKKNYSEANWINIISRHLLDQKPIVYAGSGSGGGHAFVCDGYDSDNNLHFNWGWNGEYEGYYFPTDNLTPGQHDYTNNQFAIINMFPQVFKNEDEIILRAKLPSDWGTTISAWVWRDGITGKMHNLSVNDGYVEYKTTDDVLNIILVNGSDWSTEENQTIDISTDRSACIVIGEDNDSETDSKRSFYYMQCAHDITLDVIVPKDWKNTISAWVWSTDNDGHWETLKKQGNRYQLTYHGEVLNAVIVNGNNWSDENNQTVDITIDDNACVAIGEESSGKRSYYLQDCERQITVKAQMPSDWGETISAWAWNYDSDGQWVTLQKEGNLYSYSCYSSRLNIIFVNGSDWSGDNNQTMDISTQYDACYQIGTNSGKRIAIATDCSGNNSASGGIEDVPNSLPSAHKIIVNGQILILRGDKTYTITGQEVK